VQYAKWGRHRAVPLEQEALDAFAVWVKARPTCAHEQLLVSLPRTGRAPAPLAVRDITRIVARYARYAQLAELPEDRRSPHVLRHTFCTHLAESGEPIEVIRELALDLRTTTIYTDVSRMPSRTRSTTPPNDAEASAAWSTPRIPSQRPQLRSVSASIDALDGERGRSKSKSKSKRAPRHGPALHD
jgi:integrase